MGLERNLFIGKILKIQKEIAVIMKKTTTTTTTLI